MKKWNAIGILTILVIGMVLMSGCTNRGSTSTSTPTPHIGYVTGIGTPTPTITSAQEPIVGTWQWTVIGQSKTIFYSFASDGNYSVSDSINEGRESGKWIKSGENQYNVIVSNKKLIFIYQPETGTIAMANNPDLRFYPISGNLIKTSTLKSPTTLSTTYLTTYTSAGSKTIGESVTESKQQVTVLSYEQLDSVYTGMVTIKPAESNQFLAFTVEIKNTGSNKIFVSDSDFFMSDDEGTQFSSFSKTEIYYSGWYEDLMPNLQIKRVVIFSIPKDRTGLKISYNFGSSFSGEQIATWEVD